MSRIRFGARSILRKKYSIDKFDFLQNNLDKFNILYSGLDIWNDKQTVNKNIQVELRIEYFHFMYIPVLPTAKIWTLRKSDGKLYDINSVKYRIESRVEKSYFPIYTFLLPILIFLSISIYLLSVYGQFHYRNYKKDLKEQAKISELKEKANKMNPPFYLIINQIEKPKKSFRRVDSIIGDIYYLSKLSKKVDTFTSGTKDYVIYKAFTKNKLVKSKIYKSNLDILITNTSDFSAKRVVDILSEAELENQELDD